jgi:uncharacterized protein YukE
MQLFETVVSQLVGLISWFSSKEKAFAIAFIILGASLVIWAVAVFRPHRRFMSAVRGGIRTVNSAADDESKSPEDRLAVVNKPLMDNPILGLAWPTYRDALRNDGRREGHFLNPVDPYGWFALERLPGRGYEKWASTLAGVCLTVGLLFTFIGLSAALLKVGEVGVDTTQLRSAVSDILHISAAKFITSMAGILAYIGWTLEARRCASTQSKLAAAFSTAVQRLSSPITPESLLLDQLEEARAQTDRLKTFADDIAVALDAKLNRTLGDRLDGIPAAVGAALQPALENSVRPVIAAITNMGGSIGEGNHAALENMISGVLAEVKNSTGREMGMLVEAMRETATELRDARSGIGAGGAELGQTLARAALEMGTSAQKLTEAMTGKVGEMDDRMRSIGETLVIGANRIGDMGGSMSRTLEEGLRQAMEGIKAATTAGAETARGQAEAGLAPMLRELRGLMADIRTSADESRGALVAGGQSAASDLQNALSRAGDSLSDASAKASNKLAASFEGSTDRMLDGVGRRMVELEARMDGIGKALSSGAQNLDAMGGQMSRTMVEGLQRAMESLAAAATSGAEAARGQAQATLEPLLLELKHLMSEIRTSAEDSRGALVAGGRSAANDLGTAVAAAGESLTDASAKVSSEIIEAFDASTSRILSTVEGSVAEYRAVTDGLAAQLQDVARGFRTLEKSIQQNAERFSDAGVAVALAGQGFGTAADRLQQATAPVLSTLQAVESTAASTRDALRIAQDGSQQMREANTALSATAASAAKAFESYETRFSGVDKSLEATFGTMRDGVVALGEAVSEAVGTYDKHLSGAVGLLSGAIAEIRDAVDDIGAKIVEPV